MVGESSRQCRYCYGSYAFRTVVGEIGTNDSDVVLESYQVYHTHCVRLPFLARTKPTIDWNKRVLRVERKGKVFEIKALAIADSYRMTCPVVRVANVGEGEVEAERVVADEEKVEVLLANFQAEAV